MYLSSSRNTFLPRRSCLKAAVVGGHTSLVEFLLTYGENRSHEAKRFCEAKGAALIDAVRGGFENIVRLLINFGTNVNTRRGKWKLTALHWAGTNGTRTIIRLLLQARVDIEARDVDDETPLRYAIRMNLSEVVEELVVWGASVENARDSTYLQNSIG